MKILFCSSDDISLPLLDTLNTKGMISCVFTSPDSTSKHGKVLESPVKKRAKELNLPFYTPLTLGKEIREIVKSSGIDTLISFSYGKIFGPKFLSLFKHTMNIHPSLLPSYRGCTPIENEILNRDREGGITVQEISKEIDEGGVYLSETFPLDGNETSLSLRKAVSARVPELVLSALDNISRGSKLLEQSGEATYTKKIEKEDAFLNFRESWNIVHSKIRAYYPSPKAYTFLEGERISIVGVYGSVFDEKEESTEEPGTVVSIDKKKGLKVSTGDGYIYITKVLPEGKKEMDSLSFYNGRKDIIGKVFNGKKVE